MKVQKKRWRPTPALVAMVTAVTLIAGTLVIGWLNARRYRVNANVEITGPAAGETALSTPTSIATTSLPDGEVARLATRIREATGLLMGVSLFAVNQQMGNRNPSNVDVLVEQMAENNLLPPGIRRTSTKNSLVSEQANLYLRYRSFPFGMEIVSVGREPLDGPAVIARLTATGDNNSGAVLLVAKRINGITLPQAFAPLSDVTALNWSVEQLRESSLTPDEMAQLDQWVRQYATNGQ